MFNRSTVSVVLASAAVVLAAAVPAFALTVTVLIPRKDHVLALAHCKQQAQVQSEPESVEYIGFRSGLGHEFKCRF